MIIIICYYSDVCVMLYYATICAELHIQNGIWNCLVVFPRHKSITLPCGLGHIAIASKESQTRFEVWSDSSDFERSATVCDICCYLHFK